MGHPTVAELEFMDFTTFAMDPITNQAPKLRYFWGGQVSVPLVVRTPIASGLGFGTQHSQSLEAWLIHVPGLRVAMPSSAYDAKGLIKTAIRDPNPVVFAESISLYSTKGDIPDEEYALPFGRAEVKRAGDDVTLVALGPIVPKALRAAEELASAGVDVEVIDPRTVAPLDIEAIIASVRKTGRLVIAHVAHKTGGIGAEIAQQVVERAFDSLDGPPVRVAAADVPIAASQQLEQAVFPDVQDIVKACLSFRG
jgi:pyruvate dehydrogenase E1 component beta subunit